MAVDIAAFKVMRGQFTPAQYVSTLLPHIQNMKSAELDELLPFDNLEFDNSEPLVHLAGARILSVRAARWLATVAAKGPIDCVGKCCRPFFKTVFEDEIEKDLSQETCDVLAILAAREEIVELCTSKLANIYEETEEEFLVGGMLLTVGFVKKEQHVDLLNSFLHDHGYWDEVIKKIFEKAAMQEVVNSLEKQGILASLEKTRLEAQQGGKPLADALSSNVVLQRQLARMLSANSLLMTSLKFALDRKAIGEIFGDNDVHRRRAAAYALGLAPAVQDVDALKNGLSDADKRVRLLCLEALAKHIGKDKVDEYLEQMKQDAFSIKKSAEEISGFLMEKWKDVFSSVKETAGNVIEGVGSKLSGMFKRKSDAN